MAVGHDRQVVRRTVHPLGGTQLRQRLGVVAGGVGRLAHRLADDRDAGGTGTGGEGVTVGELGVLVDEGSGRGQVPGDAGCELLGQALQLGTDATVELDAGDVLGQVRSVVRRLVGRAGFLLLRDVPGPALLGAGRTLAARRLAA